MVIENMNINLRNIKENYENNKDNLIELFVEEFGEENRSEIVNIINTTYVNFSSTPEEDYKYVYRNEDLFSEEDEEFFKSRFDEYSEIKWKSKDTHMNLLNEYIKTNFPFVNMSDKDYSFPFLDSFFGFELDGGYIDYYSSKYMNLLSDANMSNETKNMIIEKQELFRNELLKKGITFGHIDSKIVDNYLNYREEMRKYYKYNIIMKSSFGKNIHSELDEYYGDKDELMFETIDKVCFEHMPWSAVADTPLNQKMKRFYYIKIPIIQLINASAKTIDANIIHEFIHRLGRKEMYSGIQFFDEINNCHRNNWFDEVLTQKLAIKIIKRAREKGIYIYNTPLCDKIGGESFYEELFPLVGDFIDEHENLFINCSFNNSGYELDSYFGNSWNTLSTYIDNCYKELEINFFSGKKLEITEDMLMNTNRLINEINDFYYNQQRHI